MQLTKAQRIVLENALVWCDVNYEPTEQEIAEFFGYVDHGKPIPPHSDAHKLLGGWTAHYGNPFSWIPAWERGITNPPMLPLAAWIYEAYFAKSPSEWNGWYTIFRDFLDDKRYYPDLTEEKYWHRVLPAYLRAVEIWHYLHPAYALPEFDYDMPQVEYEGGWTW